MAESDPGLLAQMLGRAAYEFSNVQPMLPTYLHLIVAALFPIYTGAHASLSRPSSAAKPPKRERTDDDDTDTEGDEDEEEQRIMEGLSPTDAILMPLFAGSALAGLYFLIKYLGDAILLNKILNGYFAIFGVFSVSRLITDALDIGHSLIFPRRYALRGALYHVDRKEQRATAVAGNTKDNGEIASPLPGFLARIKLSEKWMNILWADRAMPSNKWTLRLYFHRVFAGRFKIGPHGMVGAVGGLLTVAYFNLVDKPWYLTNLLGFGFSYGALQLMSPTTFATGSLILSALFFYDIYFVFFTPMMVTVAKSLDVPIKLMFPRPGPADDPTAASHAMLGLGDVVLPGIMIGLALRFDLYLFYLRQQKRSPAAKEGQEDVIEKPTYHSLAGRWSDHFWTHSFTGRPLWTVSNQEVSKPEAPFTFPKTYFKASVAGYIAGLITTLGVMMVWNHAQPALLYLVPGVLGSLWLTALIRGELDLMWNFTEEIAEDENSEKKDKDKDDKKPKDKDAANDDSTPKPKKSTKHARTLTPTTSEDEPSTPKSSSPLDRHVKRVAGHRANREVFSFSIEAPWTLKHPRSIRSDPVSSSPSTKKTASNSSSSMKEGEGVHNWKASFTDVDPVVKEAEHVGKKLRLK